MQIQITTIKVAAIKTENMLRNLLTFLLLLCEKKKNEFFHLAKNNEKQVAAAVWAKTQQVVRILVVISHFKQEDRQTDGRTN